MCTARATAMAHMRRIDRADGGALPIGGPRAAAGGGGLLAVVLAGAALTGCASDPRVQEKIVSMRAYAEPASGVPQALARISTDSYTQLSPGDRCLNADNPAAGAAVSNFANPLGLVKLHTGNRKSVRGEAPAKLASGEVALPAGVPVTVYYRNAGAVGTMSFHCRAVAWFVPADGMHYQITATIAPDLRNCAIAIAALVGDAAQPVPVTPTQTCKE
jgi:hypothetical protein